MARAIDADILLQNFDDMEPYEEYESEHDLWLDMRMEVINTPTLTPQNEPPPCYTEEKRNTAYPLCAGRGFANCAHCALWSDFEEDQDETRINRPLTLEELREMSYTDWVWAVFPELPSEENEWVRASQLYRRYSHEHYGKTWIAYRCPPEGEA